MKPIHALLIALLFAVSFGGVLSYHFYLNWPQPEIIEVEKEVLLFRPTNHTEFVKADSVWVDSGKRYVTEFWIGEDGIYYGNKTRK